MLVSRTALRCALGYGLARGHSLQNKGQMLIISRKVLQLLPGASGVARRSPSGSGKAGFQVHDCWRGIREGKTNPSEAFKVAFYILHTFGVSNACGKSLNRANCVSL